MPCARCLGTGRIVGADVADRYCFCAVGDAQRAHDVATQALPSNAIKPLVKAKLRPARRRLKKATPRKAAKAPKRKARPRA